MTSRPDPGTERVDAPSTAEARQDALARALRNFREYRFRVGKTIHDLGGYKGLAQDFGPLGDSIENDLAALTGLRWSVEPVALREAMTTLAGRWEGEAARRLGDKKRQDDPTNLLAAGINREHGRLLRAAFRGGPDATD